MRRRTLLGGGGSIEYVFSAQSTSVSVNYNGGSTSVNIKSTANGTNIGYSVVSYDGTVVTGVTTAATYVTIKYSTNPEYSQRSGNVVLKQNDSNKTITINVSQDGQTLDLVYEGILLDGTSGSYGSISFNSQVSFSNVPSWANVTYSSGKINVTATSTNSASTARLATIYVDAGSQRAYLRIIQLPSDYHSRSYVSMEGVNWAIKNVGASSVQDYGNYYMYGKGSRVYTYGDSAYEGMEDPLASTADTATQVMGSGWRMPTYDEFSALVSSFYNSYWWVSYNGVNGGVCYLDGNILFFPAAGKYKSRSLEDKGSFGYVWSSTPNSSSYAYHLYFGTFNVMTSFRRDLGISVRGVQA